MEQRDDGDSLEHGGDLSAMSRFQRPAFLAVVFHPRHHQAEQLIPEKKNKEYIYMYRK
jgi:hypothetical protein